MGRLGTPKISISSSVTTGIYGFSCLELSIGKEGPRIEWSTIQNWIPTNWNDEIHLIQNPTSILYRRLRIQSIFDFFLIKID